MTYDDHRAALIQYLKAKVDICDWHAVRDACVDIEILEAREKQAWRATKCKHPPDKIFLAPGYRSDNQPCFRKWCIACLADLGNLETPQESESERKRNHE